MNPFEQNLPVTSAVVGSPELPAGPADSLNQVSLQDINSPASALTSGGGATIPPGDFVSVTVADETVPPTDRVPHLIVWQRDNGRGVPVTFHVIDTLDAELDLATAQDTAEKRFPQLANDVAAIAAVDLDGVLSHARQRADADARTERLAAEIDARDAFTAATAQARSAHAAEEAKRRQAFDSTEAAIQQLRIDRGAKTP